MKSVKIYSHTVLTKASQFLKVDMHYLARGGFWALLSQLVVSSSTFLLAIAFAHFVSKEIYGQYKYILSLIGLIGTFTLTGLGSAVLQSVNHGYEGTIEYAFWKNIRWSILFFIGSAGSAVYYFVQGNSFLGTSLLIAGCLWPFLVSSNLYTAILVAKKDFRRNALYFDIIGNIFPYICIFLAIVLSGNPLVLIITYFVSNTLIGVLIYRKVMSTYQLNTLVDPEMIQYSKHLSFIDILSGIANNIDQVLVFHFIGPAQLALYNFATAIPDQMKGPVKNLANLIFPKFAEKSGLEIRAGMKRKVIYLLLGSLFIVTCYIILAPFIFKIFFPKYMDSVIYSQIFSISLFWMISIPASTYLSVKKKIKELYIVHVSTSVVQIILITIGVIWGGLLGLIITRVTSRLALAIANIVAYESSSK